MTEVVTRLIESSTCMHICTYITTTYQPIKNLDLILPQIHKIWVLT